MDLSSLVSRLFKMLPVFFIIMILMGIALFSIQTLLPRWQNYQTVSTQVAVQNQIINTQTAADSGSDNQTILQSQINRAQATLASVGNFFLSESEAEQVLNRLYNYAYSRGVRIVNLQAQQPAQSTTATSNAPYNTSVMQLQVGGGVANLIDFISHFQEASLPSVSIASMNVSHKGDQALLTMTLLLYTSPYASGNALGQAATIAPPSATPTATLVPPTETPLPVVIITATPVPTQTPSDTPTPSPTMTPTVIPTFTPTLTPTVMPTSNGTAVTCAGAEAIPFQVGDIAIVHFSGIDALRVLSDPNGPVTSTRTQAYNKQQLQIVAGPVCANGYFYWYIRNLSHNNDLGWVAQGKGDQRWLCQQDDSACLTN